MNLRRVIARTWGELSGLVFPARCGCCRQAVPAGDGMLCPACAADLLPLVDLTYCARCGQDVGPFALRAGEQAGVRVCGLCDADQLRYLALVRVGPYIAPLDGVIRRFKYAGGHHLAAGLGEWLSARLSAQPWFDRVDSLLAVPLHWRRRLGRGFNQSELLAEVVASRLRRSVTAELSRPVHRPPQAALPRSRRFENVRGVFAAPRPGRVKGRTFCLVDDVCTTGATLSEAARTLLRAGAAGVFAAVVAAAQVPPAYSDMLGEV